MPVTLRRALSAAATVLLVLTVTFAALHLAPGDPVRLYLGPTADEAATAATRRALGLDRPLPLQYAEWLGRFVTGDWGTSIAQRRAVTQVLRDAAGPTLLLTGLSLLLSYLAGVVLGAVQASRPGSRRDTLITALSVTAASIPSYVVGLGLVLVFAYEAALHGWPAWLRLPAIGAEGVGAEFLGPGARFADRVRHLVLPVATLALVGAAGAARFVRAALVDALRQPFVRTARAKGLGETAVIRRHALRSALVPLITLVALQLPALFSGVVFVEVIFAWPGMGRVAVQAVLGRDYPVVMAVTAVFAILVVLANLLADALVAWADPRARSGA
jgi:peptide/nickel transport system permease protein